MHSKKSKSKRNKIDKEGKNKNNNRKILVLKNNNKHRICYSVLKDSNSIIFIVKVQFQTR